MKTVQPFNQNEQIARNARFIVYIVVAAIVPTMGLFGYLGSVHNEPSLFFLAGLLLVIGVIDTGTLALIRRGKPGPAMLIVMVNFFIAVLSTVLVTKGLGVTAASGIILTYLAISLVALKRKYTLITIAAGLAAGATIYILDTFLAATRVQLEQLSEYTPYIVILLGMGFSFSLANEFRRFGLRTKVATGILATGAVIVVTLALFGISRVGTLLQSVTQKFEQSITAQIESEIINTIVIETQKADELFIDTQRNLLTMAEYRAKLEEQKNILGQGAYWNAVEKIYTQFPDGQLGNSRTDIGSVFIPNIYPVTEDTLTDLNTTAYLDFVAPNFLKANPQVVAVYYISANGAATYYPNIGLSQIVPPDFDTTAQPFFTIAAPENNPERVPRWTPAYQAPAGTGLIVTLSVPVYAKNQFIGVIGADIQITKLTEVIKEARLGESSFAFIIDHDGHPLAMPQQGYDFYRITPEQIPVNQSPTQTIFGKGDAAIQSLTREIISGATGLKKLNINGAETYIGFGTLPTVTYHFAIVAPAAELTKAVAENRAETEREIQTTLQNILIVLMALFIGALLVSLGIGEVITRPLIRLTQTAAQLEAGNLSARAQIESEDETGVLAATFNKMAETLSQSLTEMEKRILERTAELEQANARNQRRAAQFEAIARISQAISSTQTLEELLPKITESISAELNFYHVGIFLMDKHHEYAILVAANSEGGKRMLARNHRLQVGETGIVGYVTHVGQPRVALDVGQDAVFFNNPDLPNTHSEIALPLRVGAEIFGALDVQSTETNAFSQEDISILSTLADQVSIAIQNARSYQQSAEALAQAEKATQQISGQQWKQFLSGINFDGFFFDGVETRALTDADKNRPHDIAVPLVLRGKQIGAIKLSALDPNREWTDDEISMLQAAADRTALALENARLLYESQKRASKERTIGEISAKIGGITSIEGILQTAAQALGETLPGVDIAVQLTDPSAKS